MLGLVTDKNSFRKIAMSFYDNKECNSIKEFDEDLRKIGLLKSHFFRYNSDKEINYRLMTNHFIQFINCFGVVSEELLKFELQEEHYKKVDSLFVLLGQKEFDGVLQIDEDFFIDTQKALKEKP